MRAKGKMDDGWKGEAGRWQRHDHPAQSRGQGSRGYLISEPWRLMFATDEDYDAYVDESVVHSAGNTGRRALVKGSDSKDVLVAPTSQAMGGEILIFLS